MLPRADSGMLPRAECGMVPWTVRCGVRRDYQGAKTKLGWGESFAGPFHGVVERAHCDVEQTSPIADSAQWCRQLSILLGIE